MEHTFMTIHSKSPLFLSSRAGLIAARVKEAVAYSWCFSADLSRDAIILFASESIVDITGFQPQEVQGRSCFDYFHPDEVPQARAVHHRGINLDRAAVLVYARIRAKDGRWITCECCFTIVHDVLVACTSIYRRDERSERRAIEAPQIRRLFSSSPRDPRYHMLEHLSPKFKMAPVEREPRAALILNRFTRTLTVMFATNAVASILGVEPEQITGKSFYECITENCLADAIKCLESAKANDSIAYLRFWYRDPRREEDFEEEEDEEEEGGEEEDESEGEDEEVKPDSDSTDSDGGAHLAGAMEIDSEMATEGGIKREASPESSKAAVFANLQPPPSTSAATSSSAAAHQEQFSHEAQQEQQAQQTQAGNSRADERAARRARRAAREARRRNREPIPTFELEAVVSCTSDGLVVVLRKARPPIPSLHPPLLPVNFENGLFAAPWSEQPVPPYYPPELFYTFQPPLLPQYMPLQDHVKAAGGPPIDQLMKSIRDVAVFAWALVGINGNLAGYSRGAPGGESQPADGLPVWDPSAPKSSYLGPEPKRWPSPQFEEQALKPPRAASGLPYVPGLSSAESTQSSYTTATTPGGFGSISSGHATPSLWAGSTPSSAGGAWPYTPAHHHHHRHHQQRHHHQHPQPPSSSSGYYPPAATTVPSWTETPASSYAPNSMPAYAVPTTQAYQPDDGKHHGYQGHMWQ
ncbi:hypothetical protein F4780DRAFT_385941 [Xylariomycetidae sp. FL0641]|nr:hypothetical protein F4780DRAFT_385941 [Xylariomycetidae sp. FL0641]